MKYFENYVDKAKDSLQEPPLSLTHTLSLIANLRLAVHVYSALPKTFESFAKAFAQRKLLEVALFLGCWYPMTSRI